MDKDKYIKNLLEESIVDADKHIKEHYAINKDIEKLPNNCKGVEINGDVCENNDYKFDVLTGNYHSIGYMEGVKKTAEDMLMLKDFSDVEFENFLEKQKEIEIHNKKVMDDMTKYIKTRNPDLLNSEGGIG